MTALRFDDLKQHSDVLRSRNGDAITVRFVEPRDADVLQNYFRGLTSRSRYNRFLGAMSQLPPSLLDRFIHVGEADQFSVVATMQVDGFETIVGEARYAFDFATSTLRVRPVDRRPLAGPRHRQGAAEKSRMPRGVVRRRKHLRRHAALQRVHDRARQESPATPSATAPATGSWCVSPSRSTSRRRTFPVQAGSSPHCPAMSPPPQSRVDRLGPVLRPGPFFFPRL